MPRTPYVLGLLLLALAAGASAEIRTAEDVEACIAANVPERSSQQTVLFRSTDRVGSVTESRATIYWQKSDKGFNQVMMRFSAPRDLRGAGLLLLEKPGDARDMFMYLPEIAKVRRVTSHMMKGSMFGTDFSYEEFERLQGFDYGWSSELLEDTELDGHAVHVLVSRPAGENDGSAYERIVQYVDGEKCIPLKTEFYEPGDKLRKEALSDRDKIEREESGWLPRNIRIRDLRDETETDLIVEKLEVGKKIPRKMFSQRELESGAH